MTTDLIGQQLTPDEIDLLAAYDALKDLAGRDLDPCSAAGVRSALSSLGVTVTDLGLRYEHLTDFSV